MFLCSSSKKLFKFANRLDIQTKNYDFSYFVVIILKYFSWGLKTVFCILLYFTNTMTLKKNVCQKYKLSTVLLLIVKQRSFIAIISYYQLHLVI